MSGPTVIGDATLYQGDCLDVMAGLGPVDHVLADPPYEAQAHKKDRRTQRSLKTGEDASLDFAAITEDGRRDAARLACGLAQGWALFFCQAEAVGAWRDAVEAAGAKYKRPLIWVKPDSSPQFNGQMPAIGFESMVLAWCGPGCSRWNGRGRRGVFTHPVNTNRHGGHPTEKPVPLMAELVALFTDPGQSVLDPFMGSGTTGVACARAGRPFIGIESKAEYFDLACERIEKAAAQGDLFVAPPPPPAPTRFALEEAP